MNIFRKLLIALAFTVGVAQAGPILIVTGLSGSSEPGTTNAVSTNLSNLHSAVGNTVTLLDALPADLSGFAQVWDIRFNPPVSAADQLNYTAFLQAGGGLFLMGENSNFMARNNSILAFIASLGGGALGFNACFDGPQVVHAPFTGPNPVASVNYAASGCFQNNGTGDWITARANGSLGSGVAFGVGDLPNALAGALTTILDVNFMMNQFDLPNSQNLTRNLISFVGDQVDPPANVPEPGSLLLLAAAVIAASLGSRRR